MNTVLAFAGPGDLLVALLLIGCALHALFGEWRRNKGTR